MKKLPIYDSEWLRNNIECSVKQLNEIYDKPFHTIVDYQYFIDFKNISLVDGYSIINLNDLDDTVAKDRGYLIFIDELTSEFYYLDPFSLPEQFYPKYSGYKQTSIRRLSKSILVALLSTIADTIDPKLTLNISGKVDKNLSISLKLSKKYPFVYKINTFYIPKLQQKIPYSDIILNDEISVTFIGEGNDIKYIKSPPTYNDIVYNYLDEIIHVSHDDSKLYDFHIYYRKVMRDYVQNNCCNSKMFLKLLLSDPTLPFTGTWDIRKYKMEQSKTYQNLFDVIDIEISMKSSYDKNISFVKGNKRTVKEILRLILSLDSRSSEYANFLQLTSLKVMRNCVLLAQFKFKDKLETIFDDSMNKVE